MAQLAEVAGLKQSAMVVAAISRHARGLLATLARACRRVRPFKNTRACGASVRSAGACGASVRCRRASRLTPAPPWVGVRGACSGLRAPSRSARQRTAQALSSQTVAARPCATASGC